MSENQEHEDLGFLEEKPGEPMMEYNKDYVDPTGLRGFVNPPGGPNLFNDSPHVVPIKVNDQSSIDHAYNVARGHAHKNLNDYAVQCRLANDTWWRNPETGNLLVDEGTPRNKGMLLALVHSEISEALEGIRRGKVDEHLPHRPSEEVELVDALIRIFDYAGEYGLDLEGAYQEKMQYNADREDHKSSARRYEGGKQF